MTGLRLVSDTGARDIGSPRRPDRRASLRLAAATARAGAPRNSRSHSWLTLSVAAAAAAASAAVAVLGYPDPAFARTAETTSPDPANRPTPPAWSAIP